MTETASIEKVYMELLALKKEIDFIKTRIMDIEVVMTSEEEAQLEDALEQHKKGKTKKLEDLKKELGD
ncbi:hypothetical protein J4233_04545 [Candidatus Pacearchaeota archaeon]|nr:hypothetical protein [Candidatus Pacearchaeota archaeon]